MGGPTNSVQLNRIQLLSVQKSSHPPSVKIGSPGFNLSTAQSLQLLQSLQSLRVHSSLQSVLSPSAPTLPYGTVRAACAKYRYWPHVCREGLRHQTSTKYPHPPPTPMQRQEDPHTNNRSATSPVYLHTGSARVPCPRLPSSPLFVSRPTPPTDRPVASSRQPHAPPLVPFNSNRSLISIPLSPAPSSFSACISSPSTHTRPPLTRSPPLVGPGFCCFCLCIQLAYATSPRLSKDPVNGWPCTVQYETPWVGLAWSVKRRRHVCVNE